MRSLPLCSVMFAFACQPDPAASKPVAPEAAQPRVEATAAEPDEAASESSATRREGCIPLVESEIVEESYAKGLAALEESRDGEHYSVEPFEAAIEALHFAANNGHLEAQSLHGRTLFGTMFTAQAPTPEEHDDYVAALAFLRIAAKRGDEDALSFMPAITAEASEVEPPLDALPPGWVAEAFAEADAWIVCHGDPRGGS